MNNEENKQKSKKQRRQQSAQRDKNIVLLVLLLLLIITIYRNTKPRTIFGNLSSFIRTTCSSHLNLSFIIALESGIEPHFSYSLLFEIRSVSRLLKTIRKQFLWKTSSKSSSSFCGAHASEPYLTTEITVASNILILVCSLIVGFQMLQRV